MYQSLLSVLLLGSIIPSSVATPLPTLDIAIAPPAQELELQSALSASGVLILDMKSGQELFAQQGTVRRPMASITKLMTALIIAENYEMDDVVTISKAATQIAGNKAYLPPGEHFTIGDLLSALLISSANDAANALALHHSGTVPAFVVEMNKRAESLGLTSTSFANPSGLDHPRQWSTPRDIAWLTLFAQRSEAIADRMGLTFKQIYSRQGTAISLSHTHALMHTNRAVLSGKTGTTDAAGQCLVSVVEDDESQREYLVVLFNSMQRYTDMKNILAELVPTTPVISKALPQE